MDRGQLDDRSRLEVPSRCPICQSYVRDVDNFCSNCGSRLPQIKATIPRRRPLRPPIRDILSAQAAADPFAHEYERKYVTVLFADLVGSTALIDRLDPEDAWDRLAPALAAMRRAIARYGGTFCKEQGDGAMAIFGAPDADDNHAQLACLAALEIVQALSLRPPFAGRAGLHSGEVMVRPVATDFSVVYDAVGANVHLASRLESLAVPGSVLVSGATHALVSAYFNFGPSRTQTPKGLSQPVEVYEIVSRRAISRWLARSNKGLSPFVGRAAELAALRRCAAQVASRECKIMTLVAGPGAGKSRLAREFMDELLDANWSLVETECDSTDLHTPFSVLSRLVCAALELTPSADRDVLSRALEAAKERIATPPDFFLEAVKTILNLPIDEPTWRELEPSFRRRCIGNAVISIVENCAIAGPTAVLVEDLQWMDSESVTVLNEVTKGTAIQSIFFLATTRPERPALWLNHPTASDLVLPALEPTSLQLLFDSLVGRDVSLAALRQRIVAQTGGIPLFLEEVVRSLVESSALVGEPGAFQLAADLKTIAIPSTVQAIIGARIDRLPAIAKRLLQLAAVVGERVTLPLLLAMDGRSELAVRDTLNALASAELLCLADDEVDVEFPHDLVREVAYDALVRDQRRLMHGKALKAILDVSPSNADDYAETLSHHAMEAQQWSQVVRFSSIAGTRGLERATYHDAAKFLRLAIEAVDHLPPSHAVIEASIDLRLQLRAVFAATSQLAAWIDYAKEAESIAAMIGDERRRLTSIVLRAAALTFAGSPLDAIAICEPALTGALRLDSEPLRILTEYTLGQAYYAAGDFRNAARVLSDPCERLRGEKAYVRFGTPGTTRVMFLSMLAISHASLGAFVQAHQAVGEAECSAQQTGRAYDLVSAGYAGGLTNLYQGHITLAITLLQGALSLCHTHLIDIYVPVVAGQLGCGLAMAGRYEESALLLRQTVAKAQTLGQGPSATAATAYLALAMSGLGYIREGIELAQSAIQTARLNGYRGVELMGLRAICVNIMKADHADQYDLDELLEALKNLAVELGAQPTLVHTYALLELRERRRNHEENASAAWTQMSELIRQLNMVFVGPFQIPAQDRKSTAFVPSATKAIDSP
ncbi:adenylate/guanylate cyclase domain-containing protein [Reyranella sp.]|uniref:adenylate/guanylate cyclase domain-containing protein n=1 Tax=Reyranella sp. TaxID=1929291 RepID=UPI003783EF78